MSDTEKAEITEGVRTLDSHMPAPPSDDAITTMDSHMPAPPALDLDGK